jgi:hypothetical protein
MKYLPLVSLLFLVPAIGAGCSTKTDPPKLSLEVLKDPSTCTTCHKDHYREWSGSMHAYASDDPVFLAMNKRGQRETAGALGTFCVNCHAPMAVRDGQTTDGLNLASLPPSMKGVTCYFCHSVDSVDGAHNNPLHLAGDGVMRGEFTDPVANTAHNATYSGFHDRDQADSARLCGSCHDIATGHGANIERTFSEWQASVYSHLGPSGVTCSQCHMNQSANPEPIAQAPNVFSRRTHSHSFPGVDVALVPGFPEVADQKDKIASFLSTTLFTSVCVENVGTSFALRVLLDDVAAGHGFPSGSSPDRRAWVEVIAYSAGNVIYKSGVVPDGTDVLDPVRLKDDPDLWLLRDCLFDDQGKEVKMFWQAASFESNALPAAVTFDAMDPAFFRSHIVQNYPRGAGALVPGHPDRVTMRVRLQAMGRDFLQELVDSGDLDPAVRDAVPILEVTKQPILEWTADLAAAQKATGTYVEDGAQVLCVTNTTFNAVADKTPAVNHTRCGP